MSTRLYNAGLTDRLPMKRFFEAGAWHTDALETNATLRGLVAEVELDEVSNTVGVGASDVTQVEGILDQIVGVQAAAVAVHYQPVGMLRKSGRMRESGRVLAGDRLYLKQPLGEEEKCTSGYGAWEDRKEKSTGDDLRARFLLSSGHCGYVDSLASRSAYPEGQNRREVGPVNRNAFRVGDEWRTDALAVRVAGGLARNEIYRKGLSPLPVGAPTRAQKTNVLCFSGIKPTTKNAVK